MIDLYTFTTPNGFKASIALEEMGLPYQVHVVNIGKNEQHSAEYEALNPNGKIPVIVDREGPGGKPFTVIESGAILIYLAEKSGKLLSAEPRARSEAIQWLMFQMSGVGPMFGQYGHFAMYAKEKIHYAIERYRAERDRLVKVLETRLTGREYLAGEYSIADVATFTWVYLTAQRDPALLRTAPNVAAWVERIHARPAVLRGLAIPPPQG